jgi:DNA-damage-inducible protein J
MYRMATTTMVHVRLDERVKARAEKALAAMGLSVSDAVRVLLTRVAVEKALPFEVRVPNARTREAMAGLKKGKLQKLSGVDALMDDLSAKP